MEPGTLFGWCFLAGAAAVGMAIVVRGVLRLVRQPSRRIAAATTTALMLSIWATVTYYMLHYVFEVMWMLAHTRPSPVGLFPEGGIAYAIVAGYLALGVVLVILAGRGRTNSQ